MNVLVVSPLAIMNATFETDLEIVQNHLELGDQVTMLVCGAELAACEANLPHQLPLCLRCISRRKAGIAALTTPPRVESLVQLTDEDRQRIASLPSEFSDIEALRAFKVENFDVGWGILSTIATMMRDPAPDVRRLGPTIQRLLRSSVATFWSVRNHIRATGADRVYLFNGRFATMRAVMRAAQGLGVDCFMQERASSFRHYELFKNKMPHDPVAYQELIQAFWDEGTPKEREIMGSALYLENAQGICHFFVSFTGDQQKNLLPSGWDPKQNNVAVYPGSDDEWVAIGDIARHPVYKDQLDALTRIRASLLGDERIHLYVRLHPNLRTMKQDYVQRFFTLAAPNVTLIPPESPVSTYDLMRAATRVLTFGSTTGIEAVYWGRPSILAGPSFYGELGGTYNPRTHEETLLLLKQADLPPKSREAAVKFGYFTRMHGIRFRHFQPMGLPGGPFRGRVLAPDFKTRVVARVMEKSFGNLASRVHRGWVQNHFVA